MLCQMTYSDWKTWAKKVKKKELQTEERATKMVDKDGCPGIRIFSWLSKKAFALIYWRRDEKKKSLA